MLMTVARAYYTTGFPQDLTVLGFQGLFAALGFVSFGFGAEGSLRVSGVFFGGLWLSKVLAFRARVWGTVGDRAYDLGCQGFGPSLSLVVSKWKPLKSKP